MRAARRRRALSTLFYVMSSRASLTGTVFGNRYLDVEIYRVNVKIAGGNHYHGTAIYQLTQENVEQPIYLS
jgi:hypothetical protein